MTFSLSNPNKFPGAYKGGDPIVGVWTYNGFEPGVGPGMDATDLFLAVKYSNRFSMFFFPEVNPGDFFFHQRSAPDRGRRRLRGRPHR